MTKIRKKLIINFQEKIENIDCEIANMISEQNALKIKIKTIQI